MELGHEKLGRREYGVSEDSPLYGDNDHNYDYDNDHDNDSRSHDTQYPIPETVPVGRSASHEASKPQTVNREP